MSSSKRQKQNAQQIMQKLQQILPNLKTQLTIQVRNQYIHKNNTLIQEKRQELKNYYSEKLKEQICNINSTIKAKMAIVKEKCQIKKNQKIKKRVLTAEQQNILIESTVQQILNEPTMVLQVKNKMIPKIQERIFFMLEQQLKDVAQNTILALQSEYQQQRQQWQEQRRQHWRKQSNIELQQLAQQYKQLEYKKTLIEQSLQTKKNQKENLQKKLKQNIQKNTEIAKLKKQIKQLQKI